MLDLQITQIKNDWDIYLNDQNTESVIFHNYFEILQGNEKKLFINLGLDTLKLAQKKSLLMFNETRHNENNISITMACAIPFLF